MPEQAGLFDLKQVAEGQTLYLLLRVAPETSCGTEVE